MERIQVTVKAKRGYDSSRRREQAERTRSAILDIAHRQFLEQGYAATTVVRVAEQAGTSVETLYKRSAGKRASCALSGNRPSPVWVRFQLRSAQTRSARLQKTRSLS